MKIRKFNESHQNELNNEIVKILQPLKNEIYEKLIDNINSTIKTTRNYNNDNNFVYTIGGGFTNDDFGDLIEEILNNNKYKDLIKTISRQHKKFILEIFYKESEYRLQLIYDKQVQDSIWGVDKGGNLEYVVLFDTFNIVHISGEKAKKYNI